MDIFVHPQGLCESRNIGRGTRIWAFAHVLPGAVIGSECNICDHVFVENDVVIGDRVTVKCGVQLWDGIRLEDDVFVGPNVTFTNDRIPKSKRYPTQFLKTFVLRGASIGAGATILPGLVLKEYSLVAAGSVVTHDVPARVLVRGSPARPVSFLDADLVEADVCASADGGCDVLPGVRLRRLRPAHRPGTLTVAEIEHDIPFLPRSFTAVTGPADGSLVGDFARVQCSQFMVLMTGRVTVLVDNARERRAIRLSAAGDSLLIPPGNWGGQLAFARDTVLGVFASCDDNEADHVRNYGEFLTRFGR